MPPEHTGHVLILFCLFGGQSSHGAPYSHWKEGYADLEVAFRPQRERQARHEGAAAKEAHLAAALVQGAIRAAG
eukprot:scaffold196493_cov41-Prasinocladus_malaysianus.AAC.1